MELDLTIKERLFLINQYSILSELTEDEYDKKNYETLIAILERGYTRYYSKAISAISEEELSDKECKAVVDILDLYSDLYFYWRKDETIQKDIDESEVLFRGFDGNENAEYLGLYKFLLNDLGRFSDIKDLHEQGLIEGYNSHGFGPDLFELKNMVRRWKEIKSKDDFEKLTLSDFKHILS